MSGHIFLLCVRTDRHTLLVLLFGDCCAGLSRYCGVIVRYSVLGLGISRAGCCRSDPVAGEADRFVRCRPGTRAIQGTHRGDSVTHYLDSSSGLNVISRNGEFIRAWMLNSDQLVNILRNGSLGGG